MKVEKVNSKNKLNTFTELEGYDQYLAIDWSQDGFSLARLTSKSRTPKWFTGIAKVEIVKDYLKTIRGKKILTIEETTSTHWLYVELKEYVDKIVVCDPYRNKLLNEGAKNDDIDAGKLFERQRIRKLNPVLINNAYKKLLILDAAERLSDLKIPPGNKLEKLSGSLSGYYSIRINDKWRIIFSWQNSNANNVQILDYHKG